MTLRSYTEKAARPPYMCRDRVARLTNTPTQHRFVGAGGGYGPIDRYIVSPCPRSHSDQHLAASPGTFPYNQQYWHHGLSEILLRVLTMLEFRTPRRVGWTKAYRLSIEINRTRSKFNP